MNNTKTKDNKASYIFEQLYKPNEQHFDLKARRNKNIKILENIINDIENVEKLYFEQKRQVILDIESNDDIVDKDKAIDEEYEIINRCIEANKRILKDILRNTIKKQIKYMLILKEPKKVYEYYKLITTYPLKGDYSELEKDLYIEFIMRNPYIKNIIISYSELDANEVSNKEELKETDKKIQKDNDDDDDNLQEAQRAVDKALQERTRESIKKAYNKVNFLKEDENKKSLLQKLDKLVLDMTKEVKDSIDKYEDIINNADGISIETRNLIDEEKLKDIVSKFNELYMANIPEINFSEAVYGEKLNKIIDIYNMQEQNNYKVIKETNKTSKVKKGWDNIKAFWKRTIELKPFFFTNKKKTLDKYKKALIDAPEDQKEFYKSCIKEIDIVNTPKLFTSRSRLERLKPKLYKFGADNLNDKNYKKYTKAVNKISDKLLGGLLETIEENEAVNDKLRVKTVIGQLLELVSICQDEVNVTNAFGKVTKTFSKKEVVDIIDKYLNQAKDAETITVENYNAYQNELRDILSYRKDVDDYYEIATNSHVDDEEITYHDELDNEASMYYKNPVRYKDKDANTHAFHYIKHKRQ